MTWSPWHRRPPRRAATAQPHAPQRTDRDPAPAPVRPGLSGRIQISDQVAERLRIATASLITDACRSLPQALTDEQRLPQSLSALGEVFHLVMLRAMLLMLSQPSDASQITIETGGQLRPLLQAALQIASHAARADLTKTTTGEQRRHSASQILELQILARQLALIDRSREPYRPATPQ